MKPTRVGKFELGYKWVELYIDFSKTGGHFTTEGPNDLPRITIGGQDDGFNYIIEILLHEALEMAFSDVRGRFRWTPDFANASDGYVFHFDHNQFSEAVARVGTFMDSAFLPLMTVYKKHKSGRKR